jgi:hypothetical protein
VLPTKNNPAKASDAHITMVGAISRAELLRAIDEVDADNGLLNRFLWSCSRRSKPLPEGGCLFEVAESPEWVKLQEAFNRIISRTGDLWLCGKHRVLCGDSCRAEDVARLLDDRKPILLVCDPPYGIERFRVARPRRPERVRSGRSQLYEAPHRWPHGDQHLR